MRAEQFQQGRRNGVKACVERLHALAAEMNDPKARAILNVAALDLGVTLKGPNVARSDVQTVRDRSRAEL
jgi:hypothetical protein